MEYSFPHYLLSKQTVDDRALNRHIYETLVAKLPPQPVRVIEAGAGIGTMLTRLIRWGLLQNAEYVALDEMAENISYSLALIPKWAAENKLHCIRTEKEGLAVWDENREIQVTFKQADVFEFIKSETTKYDLLIANAVLDLFPLPESLPQLFSLLKPASLAWLTVNFDGVTTFEPPIDPALDAKIEELYHRSMDTRPTGGDSRTGRHLFGHLKSVGAQILAAGASDWVVHPVNGKYIGDEAYFLYFILHFFEESLTGHKELDLPAFADWLAKRRKQVERGELIYIAHQMDFLARV